MKLLSQKRYQVALIVLSAFVTNGYASHPGQYQVVDGLRIYLAVLPAEMLRGHPIEHPASQMHRDTYISGKRQHHIMVSLFDVKTGVRYEHARIMARIIGDNFTGPERLLEIMVLDETQSYGNYFNLPDGEPYQIELVIQRGADKKVKVVFQHARI